MHKKNKKEFLSKNSLEKVLSLPDLIQAVILFFYTARRIAKKKEGTR
jgi:hypothetical protein